MRDIFKVLIEKIWVTFIKPPTSSTDSDKEYEEYNYGDEPGRVFPDIGDTVDANGKLLNQQPVYNKIIQPEVSLRFGEDMIIGRVTILEPVTPAQNLINTNPFASKLIPPV